MKRRGKYRIIKNLFFENNNSSTRISLLKQIYRALFSTATENHTSTNRKRFAPAAYPPSHLSSPKISLGLSKHHQSILRPDNFSTSIKKRALRNKVSSTRHDIAFFHKFPSTGWYKKLPGTLKADRHILYRFEKKALLSRPKVRKSVATGRITTRRE